MYKIQSNPSGTRHIDISEKHLEKIEKHPGSYEIVYVKDLKGKTFSTRLSNVFIIGENKEDVTVLKTHTRYSVIEEREYRMGKKKVDDEDTA